MRKGENDYETIQNNCPFMPFKKIKSYHKAQKYGDIDKNCLVIYDSGITKQGGAKVWSFTWKNW